MKIPECGKMGSLHSILTKGNELQRKEKTKERGFGLLGKVDVWGKLKEDRVAQ